MVRDSPKKNESDKRDSDEKKAEWLLGKLKDKSIPYISVRSCNPDPDKTKPKDQKTKDVFSSSTKKLYEYRSSSDDSIGQRTKKEEEETATVQLKEDANKKDSFIHSMGGQSVSGPKEGSTKQPSSKEESIKQPSSKGGSVKQPSPKEGSVKQLSSKEESIKQPSPKNFKEKTNFNEVKSKEPTQGSEAEIENLEAASVSERISQLRGSGLPHASEQKSVKSSSPKEAPPNVTDKASSSVTDKASSNVTEKASSSVTDKASSSVTDKASSNVTEKASSSVTDKASSNVADKASSNVADKASSNVADKASSNVTEKISSSAMSTSTTKGLEPSTADNQKVSHIKLDLTNISSVRVSSPKSLYKPRTAAQSIKSFRAGEVAKEPTTICGECRKSLRSVQSEIPAGSSPRTDSISKAESIVKPVAGANNGNIKAYDILMQPPTKIEDIARQDHAKSQGINSISGSAKDKTDNKAILVDIPIKIDNIRSPKAVTAKSLKVAESFRTSSQSGTSQPSVRNEKILESFRNSSSTQSARTASVTDRVAASARCSLCEGSANMLVLEKEPATIFSAPPEKNLTATEKNLNTATSRFSDVPMAKSEPQAAIKDPQTAIHGPVSDTPSRQKSTWICEPKTEEDSKGRAATQQSGPPSLTEQVQCIDAGQSTQQSILSSLKKEASGVPSAINEDLKKYEKAMADADLNLAALGREASTCDLKGIPINEMLVGVCQPVEDVCQPVEDVCQPVEDVCQPVGDVCQPVELDGMLDELAEELIGGEQLIEEECPKKEIEVRVGRENEGQVCVIRIIVPEDCTEHIQTRHVEDAKSEAEQHEREEIGPDEGTARPAAEPAESPKVSEESKSIITFSEAEGQEAQGHESEKSIEKKEEQAQGCVEYIEFTPIQKLISYYESLSSEGSDDE